MEADNFFSFLDYELIKNGNSRNKVVGDCEDSGLIPDECFRYNFMICGCCP